MKQQLRNLNTSLLGIWAFQMPCQGFINDPDFMESGFIAGLTKSEARANLKKEHGLKRVPVGTHLWDDSR